MNAPDQVASPSVVGEKRYVSIFRGLASIELGVILLALLAVVLMVATLLEAKFGPEFSCWYFYHSTWFIILLGALNVNVLAAILVRLTKKPRWGFLMAHTGILVLSAGSLMTYLGGISGRCSLIQGGEAEDRIVLPDQFRITVLREIAPGKESPKMDTFQFKPGPVNWSDTHPPFRFEDRDGLSVAILKYYRFARIEEDWVLDPEKRGLPALQFAVVHPEGATMLEGWLSNEPLGVSGLMKLEILRAPVDSMREDFLNPPSIDPSSPEADEKGVLSVHYEGRVQRIPVEKNLGKKVPLEGSKIEVEIVRYFANAKPRETAQFESQGDEPRNPLLDLRIHLPGKEEPIRELAFAKSPGKSLALMHGSDSPVNFWYHQPALPASPGVEFLQTPDGKLFARAGVNGKYVARGEVGEGSRIEMLGKLQFQIRKYLPFASPRFLPRPIDPRSKEAKEGVPAVLVELDSGGTKQQVGLILNDPNYSFQLLNTPKGRLSVHFGYDTEPLGFSVKLLKFTREVNPGNVGDAAYHSSVQIIDEKKESGQTEEIYMNHPVTYGKYTFYQSNFDKLSSGEPVSILSVSYDPGRFLKYLGSSMICIGIALRYLSRRKKTSEGVSLNVGTISLQGDSPRTRMECKSFVPFWRVFLFLVGWLSCLLPVFAETSSSVPFDWKPWRALPVQEGGRQKPLDTLARESILAFLGSSTFTDPKTGQTYDAVALYMTLILERQGEDRPKDKAHPTDSDPLADYFRLRQPDRWDKTPLLPVDSRELQKMLALPEGKTHIAPLDLYRAEVKAPKSSTTFSFMEWVGELVRIPAEKLTYDEKQAIELIHRLEAYLQIRLGFGLDILPIPGNEHQEWISLASILADAPEIQNQSFREVLKQVKEQYEKVRKAYNNADPSAFRNETAAFLSLLQKEGSPFGTYPKSSVLAWEIFYNETQPFRLAWILAIPAAVLALVPRFRYSKAIHVTAFLILLVSFAVTLGGFTLRSMIAGRAPITNMYESVVSVGLGLMAMGMVFAVMYRKGFLLSAGALLGAITLILADSFPTLFDPRIRPLPPVLRSDFWLMVHVSTIMTSYAAFALSWILANASLPSFLGRLVGKEVRSSLGNINLAVVRFGVLFLTIGTILGGFWADYSWGRFWGWDPKEVWALISLLLYLVILHCRAIGWIREFGVAFSSVLAFVAVMMTWYGVNFVLGSGLHSYGFGSGDEKIYVVIAMILQTAYLLLIGGLYLALKTPPSSKPENE